MVPPRERAIAVALGAYNIALCDFLEDSAIGGTSWHVRSECALYPGIPIIELHHEGREAIPAVKARYTAETREQFDLTEPDLRLGG
jgi:hypothetical protein